MKIKCIKTEKCPICGDKGSIQVFFNKAGEVKYARTRHYIPKGDKGYNPNNKYNFRYCKLNFSQIETVLTSHSFQSPIAEAQSNKVGQVDIGTSEKIHDQTSVSLLGGQADSRLNLKREAGPLGFEPRTFSLEG
jgi:hypothetical protein